MRFLACAAAEAQPRERTGTVCIRVSAARPVMLSSSAGRDDGRVRRMEPTVGLMAEGVERSWDLSARSFIGGLWLGGS